MTICSRLRCSILWSGMKRLPRKQNKWLELEISQAIDRYCVLSSKHRMQISCNKVIYGLASCADARQGRHAFPLSPPHEHLLNVERSYHYRLPVACLSFQEKPTRILYFGRRKRVNLKGDSTWRNDGMIGRRIILKGGIRTRATEMLTGATTNWATKPYVAGHIRMALLSLEGKWHNL